MNRASSEGVWLREYIETNFKPDPGWIGIDSKRHIPAAHIAGDSTYTRGAPAYWPFKQSKRIWNKVTFSEWKLPLFEVFQDIKFIWTEAGVESVEIVDYH